ncbi:hypothetical protein ENKO_160 [Klebsiella phage fENko-Kae01]|nr:hypothetical protein [Klebsiella phage fENko-Kae01]
MIYTSLSQFVQMDIGAGKVFYVSGYANPKLRTKPLANVKPVRVTLHNNDPANPYRTGMYYHDKQLKFLLAKTDDGKVVSAVSDVLVFDTEEEARSWYNQEVQKVADQYKEKYEKVLGNLL